MYPANTPLQEASRINLHQAQKQPKRRTFWGCKEGEGPEKRLLGTFALLFFLLLLSPIRTCAAEEEAESTSLSYVYNPQMQLSYDEAADCFVYTLSSGETIRSSVPQGGWTTGRVTIELSDGLGLYRLLKDGTASLDFSSLSFLEPGSYRLTIWDNVYGANGDIATCIDFCFRIYEETPVSLSFLAAPEGFTVLEVLLDGVALEKQSEDYVLLETDGVYEIAFVSEDKTAVWQMGIERDTTPPVLLFSEEVTYGGTLYKAISFQKSEAGATLTILRNNVEVAASKNTIVQSGNYHMTITDSAGNSAEYRFKINVGYEIGGTYTWIILLGILLVVLALMAWARRHARVL